MADTGAALLRVLDAGLAEGGLQTDDVLALVLPLLRQVAALHEQARVAQLDGVEAYDQAEDGGLRLTRPEGRAPRDNRAAIERLAAPATSVLRVVGQSRIDTEVGADGGAGPLWQDLSVSADDEAAGAPLARPQYLTGYRAWEHRLDHHDELSDILCLGQVLASLACGLDFTSAEDLQLFAAHRDNLFALRERLHPVVAGVIVEMTALDRHMRARDLPSLVRRLETYRDQPADLALGRVAAGGAPQQRRRAVQEHLRDRLFDLSRRNRLLYFRPTQSSVNLTVASVPLVVDLNSIRLDQLCVWGGRFAEEVVAGERIAMARWLRFEDQPYLPAALDHIIQEARRDRAEYGFSQLSLVLAFLRWHNLKEARDERVVSPLLLLPVELSRKKGVRDQYILEAPGSEAEVNPALRHQLRQLYGIELPESVDLRSTTIEDFHRDLLRQIQASEPGVQLRLLAQPEIELIHQRARQRLEQFRRRRRVREPRATPVAAYDYSYAADDFRPLGLQLFHDKVRPTPLPLRDAVGAPPAPRHPQMSGASSTPELIERTTYALHDSAANPYRWDVDLTAVTLGNFNYRKMSLVRDYSALIEADLPNPAFDRVFSLQPRAVETDPPPSLAPGDHWAVVRADATQSAAVALARGGASYIIQGPPGTGKSQTITNLIADYVGRGQRVLFVCEKRAAIDVVFHRLRQQGLDELCCMIHDSQADKKAFVQNLRQTYEQWLATPDELDEALRRRGQLAEAMAQDLEALLRFDAAMLAVPAQAGVAVRELLQRLVLLREHDPRLGPAQAEALPGHDVWLRHAGLAERLQRAVAETTGAATLAQHVFSHLGLALVRHERPLTRLLELADRAEAGLDRAGDGLADALQDQLGTLSLGDVLALGAQARQLAEPAARGQLALLDPLSGTSRGLTAACDQVGAAERALAAAAEATVHWQDKLSAADTVAALAQARAQERSLLRWLSPSWWRLRGELARRYRFAAPAVAPAPSQVLAALHAEQQAQSRLQAACEEAEASFGLREPQQLVQRLQALREAAQGRPALADWHRRLLADEPAAARGRVQRLAEIASELDRLEPWLGELLHEPARLRFESLGELLRDLRENADQLPELLPLLQELADADAGFADTLRTLPLSTEALEFAVAHEALARVYRSERWLPRFDGVQLARHAQRLDAAERELLEVNARALRAGVRRRFGHNVHRSTLAASQLDAEGKLFKKQYAAGRRELEHEFGKSMRYKSIRELASGDSGRVVRDMKPVWLMSPLSVSDTLPLDARLFDVVIFDEASQIPVEEAVPALYRAPQVIVVGDEMQLPPTSFFASSSQDEDDAALAIEEEGERVAVVLDADSLLNQAARNLPATLLAWHYRSRHECLIGFSNAAFYAGNLYTIPDRGLPAPQLSPIVLNAGETAPSAVAAQADALLARPISHHFVAGGVYAQRRNEAEAACIAQLVRELLARHTGQSLGIVAFSEAQQSEIESALDALAAADSGFAARLEAEYLREEDDQFCGLFVKNLENVQGDERDIVILSICYAPGPDGRMLMNFGPINQRGGEKRLNVIFSRARHHMAVVASIRHEAITNDHNEGAAALKQFLRYAECSSRGDAESARRLLENLNPLARKALGSGDGTPDEVVRQLAAALRSRGHMVDEQVGQSRFRCELAVRDASLPDRYALGIVVDTAAQYANRDVFERHVARPRALAAFGWRTLQVLSRDWHEAPDSVLARVERALSGAVEELPAVAPMAEVQPAAAPAREPEREPVPQAAAEPPPAAVMPRRFECTEGPSRKFWQIACTGCEVAVTFGRIGSRGQTQVKQFDSEARAQREQEKLVAEKLAKGYLEV